MLIRIEKRKGMSIMIKKLFNKLMSIPHLIILPIDILVMGKERAIDDFKSLWKRGFI